MLEFCETCGHLDIWKETDTPDGKVKYMFWSMGICISANSEKEILEKANEIVNKNKGKSR